MFTSSERLSRIGEAYLEYQAVDAEYRSKKMELETAARNRREKHTMLLEATGVHMPPSNGEIRKAKS